MMKAMAPLPLIFLPISIGASVIFGAFWGNIFIESLVKATASLPLIFLPISIGGSVISRAILGHFCGVLGGYLVNGEGRGPIAQDLLAHIKRW